MKGFLRRLFGKQSIAIPASTDVQTAPLVDEQLSLVEVSSTRYEPGQMLVGTGQSVGKQREHNEDTIFFLNSILAGNGDSLPFGIFIVADGMGGHEHGEIASSVAVRAVASYLVRRIYMPFIGIHPEAQGESMQELLQSSVHEAQQAVMKLAPGGGTTLTIAFVLGEQVTLAHVGDSRAYFIYSDGRIQAATRDHSLVRRLMELGQITEKEAAVHPQRNVLYRAIGQGEPFDADINTFLLPRPGFLLLCSDGLWGVVSDEDVQRIVSTAASPSEACRNLVDAANAAGGPDNISVVIVQIPK